MSAPLTKHAGQINNDLQNACIYTLVDSSTQLDPIITDTELHFRAYAVVNHKHQRHPSQKLLGMQFHQTKHPNRLSMCGVLGWNFTQRIQRAEVMYPVGSHAALDRLTTARIQGLLFSSVEYQILALLLRAHDAKP